MTEEGKKRAPFDYEAERMVGLYPRNISGGNPIGKKICLGCHRGYAFQSAAHPFTICKIVMRILTNASRAEILAHRKVSTVILS